MKNLAEMLTGTADQFGEITAPVVGGNRFTYAEIARLSRRFTAALADLNIGHADKAIVYRVHPIARVSNPHQ